MALSRRPETSVQIVEYRPVYILGDVERPGEYPYRPGLTALQALGGLAPMVAIAVILATMLGVLLWRLRRPA